MRIITVVMGESDSKVRNNETTGMLDYAFANYKLDTILSKNTILKKETVDKGKKKFVEIVPTKDVTSLRKVSEKEKKIDYTLHIDTIKAPTKKGKVIGKMEITEDGKNKREIDLTVKENVEKANLIDLYIKYLKEIFSGNIAI